MNTRYDDVSLNYHYVYGVQSLECRDLFEGDRSAMMYIVCTAAVLIR